MELFVNKLKKDAEKLSNNFLKFKAHYPSLTKLKK